MITLDLFQWWDYERWFDYNCVSESYEVIGGYFPYHLEPLPGDLNDEDIFPCREVESLQ